jgi:hypothetical protein
MKFSFNDIIKDLVDIIFSVYPKVGYPPFLETSDLALEGGYKNSNYSEDLNQFKKVLNNSDKYLENFDCLTFNELLIRYSNSEMGLQKVIYEKILQRLDSSNVLGNEEIENISKIKMEKQQDSQNLFDYLIRKYYLFSIHDFSFSN